MGSGGAAHVQRRRDRQQQALELQLGCAVAVERRTALPHGVERSEQVDRVQPQCVTLQRLDPVGVDECAGTGARGYAGDGGDARVAVFAAPKEMTIDAVGNIFVVDTENHAIRLIDAKTWIVTTIAGNGAAGPGGDGGPATQAGLGRPHGVCIGPDGAAYVGDSENHRVRRLTRMA